MQKKLSLLIILVLFVFLASGCVKKTEAPTETGAPAPVTKKDNLLPASSSTQEETLPKATGKVDDLANAVSDEADSEKNNLSEEENVASDVADDAEEINNLENSYDENEL